MKPQYRICLVVKENKDNFWVKIDEYESTPEKVVEFLHFKYVGLYKKTDMINKRIKSTLFGEDF